jgi:hypothetical protein
VWGGWGDTGATEHSLHEAGATAATLPLELNCLVRKRFVWPVASPDELAGSSPCMSGHLMLVEE